MHDGAVLADLADDREVVRDEQKVMPSDSRRSMRRLMIWAWTLTSSAETASSRMSRRGWTASARAIAAH
jgi:hypothetical protein